MTGPYREAPKFLICPRCGEMLDRVFDDVVACMRCEGILITPPTAGLAFDDPAWPSEASGMWWKSSLECPVCAYAGAKTIMTAQSLEGTQIDRCATHGLWLDRGELNRLLKTTGNELAELRRRLHGDDIDLEKLDAKREAWRKDVEARRKAAEEYNAFLADKRRREIEEAMRRQAAETAAADEQRHYQELLERAQLRIGLEIPPPSPEAATWREQQEGARRAAADRQRRDQQRVTVMQAIGELESQLAELRLVVRDVEAKLASERTKLRALAEHDEPKRLG